MCFLDLYLFVCLWFIDLVIPGQMSQIQCSFSEIEVWSPLCRLTFDLCTLHWLSWLNCYILFPKPWMLMNFEGIEKTCYQVWHISVYLIMTYIFKLWICRSTLFPERFRTNVCSKIRVQTLTLVCKISSVRKYQEFKGICGTKILYKRILI